MKGESQIMKRMWSKNELKNQTDARVQALVEGGTLDNAKPIFCHPIHMLNEQAGENNFNLTMLIFNNDPTPFTPTTFATWIDNLLTSLEPGEEVQVLVSGGFMSADGNNIIIASYLFDNATQIGVAGMKADGSLYGVGAINFSTLIGEHCTFKDAVNKIN